MRGEVSSSQSRKAFLRPVNRLELPRHEWVLLNLVYHQWPYASSLKIQGPIFVEIGGTHQYLVVMYISSNAEYLTKLSTRSTGKSIVFPFQRLKSGSNATIDGGNGNQPRAHYRVKHHFDTLHHWIQDKVRSSTIQEECTEYKSQTGKNICISHSTPVR